MSMERQAVSVRCQCGGTHRVSVCHYDRVVLPCGKPYWTLQPRRNGPYELKPWPGPNLTRVEMGGRPSAATIVRKMSEQDAACEVEKILPL